MADDSRVGWGSGGVGVAWLVNTAHTVRVTAKAARWGGSVWGASGAGEVVGVTRAKEPMVDFDNSHAFHTTSATVRWGPNGNPGGTW